MFAKSVLKNTTVYVNFHVQVMRECKEVKGSGETSPGFVPNMHLPSQHRWIGRTPNEVGEHPGCPALTCAPGYNGEYSGQKCLFMPQPGNLQSLIYAPFFAVLRIRKFTKLALPARIFTIVW